MAECAARPALLRERYEANAFGENKTLIIDELQKAPPLLDEVHWLIENRGVRFILTGSSARKLKRGQANVLGGRAWRRELHPITLHEMNEAAYSIHLESICQSGCLPAHLTSSDSREDLRAYVADYLKEEILEEGLVQNFPAFSQFLHIAGITNGELLNYTNISREVRISAKVVKGYFEILEDTFLGYRLAPWTRKRTRRLVQSERFYLFDLGVANYLARRKPAHGTPEFEKSFEHILVMELTAFKAYKDPELELSFWLTESGAEVDFVLNDKEVLIKVKSSTRVHETDLKSLTLCAEEGAVRKRLLGCLEEHPRLLRDRLGEVLVLPYKEFVSQLWQEEVISSSF